MGCTTTMDCTALVVLGVFQVLLTVGSILTMGAIVVGMFRALRA